MKPYKYMTKKELYYAYKEKDQEMDTLSVVLAICNPLSDDPRSDLYSDNETKIARTKERHLNRVVNRIGAEIKNRYGIDMIDLWNCPCDKLSDAQKQFLADVK